MTKGMKKNNNESNGSPSSTSSEISVGSAHFAANGGTSHLQSQILLPQMHHIPAVSTNGATNFNGVRVIDLKKKEFLKIISVLYSFL
jgi:hypothetical protein